MPMILWAVVGVVAAFCFMVVACVAFLGWMAYKIESMTKIDSVEQRGRERPSRPGNSQRGGVKAVAAPPFTRPGPTGMA